MQTNATTLTTIIAMDDLLAPSNKPTNESGAQQRPASSSQAWRRKKSRIIKIRSKQPFNGRLSAAGLLTTGDDNQTPTQANSSKQLTAAANAQSTNTTIATTATTTATLASTTTSMPDTNKSDQQQREEEIIEFGTRKPPPPQQQQNRSENVNDENDASAQIATLATSKTLLITTQPALSKNNGQHSTSALSKPLVEQIAGQQKQTINNAAKQQQQQQQQQQTQSRLSSATGKARSFDLASKADIESDFDFKIATEKTRATKIKDRQTQG